MAGRIIRSVVARFTADISDFERQMQQMSKRLDKTANELEKIGTNLTKFITIPMLAVGTAATKMAMDAVESENLFTVSMGKMAGSARAWSEDMNNRLGLNAYSVRKTVGTFNVMFTSMGLGESAAYDMSKGLTQLSYDMASFYDLSNTDAMEKLQSGISGEVEPLKKLGIVVNETAVKTYALNNGMIKQGQEMTETQKVIARYLTIIEATKKAQGDLANTITSPSNQLRLLKERVTGLAIDLGMKLIPTFLKLTGTANKALDAIKTLSPESQKMIFILAGVAAAAGPVILGISGITAALSFLMANPVVLGISALGLLIAALVKVQTELENTDDATEGINSTFEHMTSIVNKLAGAFDALAGKILYVFEELAKGEGPQTAEDYEIWYGTGKIDKNLLSKNSMTAQYAGIYNGLQANKGYAEMFAARAGYSDKTASGKDLTTDWSKEFEKLNKAGTDTYTALNDKVKNFVDSLKKQTDAFKNFVGIFDKASSEQPLSMDRWLNRLKGQVRALAQYQVSVKMLEAKANSGVISQSLFSDLRALGPSAAKQLQLLANSSNSKLSEANALYGQKSGIAGQLAYDKVNSDMATEAKMVQIVNNFNGGAKDEEIVQISKKIAKQIIKELDLKVAI